MKPFDLEKALAGDPVVTRDGREVKQFTSFDSHDAYSLFGVVNGNILKFRIDGSQVYNRETPCDLFMAEPERWVNVYWREDDEQVISFGIYSSEAEAKKNIDDETYQTTIKLK